MIDHNLEISGNGLTHARENDRSEELGGKTKITL